MNHSPFPGMDPYLEGYLWPDVHQALAYQFRRQLVPQVAPKYAVRLAVTMVTDRVPTQELGIMYPDVEVIRPVATEDELWGGTAVAALIAPASLSIPLTMPVPTRLVSVEIRDVIKNQLVTSIEILSPANKREPGLSQFMNKRDDLQLAAVNILEVDLLRRGQRPWPEAGLPPVPYLATLIRARAAKADIWPIALRDPLPALPVPLLAEDADVPLDMQAALDTIYAEAQYGLTIDYTAVPPPPPLSTADSAWAARRVQFWAA